MRKKITIVFLYLVLSLSASASDIPKIKEKSLKCLHKDSKYNISKEDYLYIVFSNDKKKATFVSPLTKNSTRSYKSSWEVKTYLKAINFDYIYEVNRWELNRLSGVLLEISKTAPFQTFVYGKCEPVEKGFDPIKYMDDFVKKNIERTKKDLKF